MQLGVTDRLRSIVGEWVGVEREPPRAAELRSRIETALDGEVGRRLGLSAYAIRAGHHLHAVGRGRAGRIFLSCFPASARDRAARIVASQCLLQDAGIDSPEVLDADLEAGTDPGFAWVALRWHEGTAPRRTHAATSRRALARLARIHRIDREALVRAGRGPVVEALPVSESFRTLATEAQMLAQALARAGVTLPAGEVARVHDFLAAGVDRMRSSGPEMPRVLLHADYQPANLRLTRDGRLLVLDLEGSSFGAVPSDLARAFFKFRFKVASGELDALELHDLLDDPVLLSLQDAYLKEASEETGKFWVAHGRTVLFFGHLRMVRRRANAAIDPRRYGPRKRSRSLRQALRRWERAVRYVTRAG